MDIVPATVGLVFTTKRIGCFVLFPGYCGWVPFFPRKKGFSSHAMQGARIFGMGTRYGLEVPFLLYLSTVCLFEHQDSLIAENFTSMKLLFWSCPTHQE